MPLRTSHKSARLAVLTFLAVLGAIFLVGLAVVPYLIQRMEKRDLLRQADINERQAKALARFAELRLAEGYEVTQVTAELQTLLTGADADRGYSCVIDRGKTQFVCHPMTMAIGMSIAGKEADFLGLTVDELEPWENVVGRGLFGPGSLFYPDGGQEIVHMEGVAGTDWTITTHENTARVRSELAALRKGLVLGAFVVGLLLAIPSSLAARAVSRGHERRIEAEQVRSEKLLLNILPPAIAERLKAEEKVIADRHPAVTVLFADIVGFTPLAADTPADQLVAWLDQLFSQFDDICAAHRLEKIKTIGDAYMLCGGIDDDPEDAARRVIQAAREMLAVMADEAPLQLRIGIHSGAVVAGVIGKRKFTYDLWGDVVNVAARLESSGVANRIQISQETAAMAGDAFTYESREAIEVKGKGRMPVLLVADN